MPRGIAGSYSIGEVPAKGSLALVVDTLKPRSFGGGVGNVYLAKGIRFLYGLFLFFGRWVLEDGQSGLLWE